MGQNKGPVDYIDMTPLWAEIVHTMLMVAKAGDNPDSLDKDFAQMARLADERNLLVARINDLGLHGEFASILCD